MDIYAIYQYVIVMKKYLDIIPKFYGKAPLNLAAIELLSFLNEN